MQTNTVRATLVAHRGAVKISRGELLTLATPPRTLTHRPVAHAEVIDLIEERLFDHRMEIKKAEFAVQSEGQKLFSSLVLSSQRTDFAFAMGVRAANDKSMALQITAGLSVFVCDNLALTGTQCALRKHTSGMNPRQICHAAVDAAIAQFAQLEGRVDDLKGVKLSDTEAKARIYDAVVERNVCAVKYLPAIGQEYFNPRHEEHTGRDLWCLHNAFTQVFHEMPPNLRIEASRELGVVFGL